MKREQEKRSDEQRGVQAPEPDESKRRKPSPADAGATSAITGVPSLSAHKKRGKQLEKDSSGRR